MAHGMTRCIERFQLDRLADFDDIAGAETTVDVGNGPFGVGVGKQFGASGGNHLLVAAGMITMLMGVHYLSDVPALVFGSGQAFLVIQRIDSQRVSGFRAGDEIVEVAVGVGGPDLFDDHN